MRDKNHFILYISLSLHKINNNDISIADILITDTSDKLFNIYRLYNDTYCLKYRFGFFFDLSRWFATAVFVQRFVRT